MFPFILGTHNSKSDPSFIQYVKKKQQKKTHDACSFSQQLFSFVRVNVFSLNLFLLLFKLFSKAAIF